MLPCELRKVQGNPLPSRAPRGPGLPGPWSDRGVTWGAGRRCHSRASVYGGFGKAYPRGGQFRARMDELDRFFGVFPRVEFRGAPPVCCGCDVRRRLRWPMHTSMSPTSIVSLHRGLEAATEHPSPPARWSAASPVPASSPVAALVPLALSDTPRSSQTRLETSLPMASNSAQPSAHSAGTPGSAHSTSHTAFISAQALHVQGDQMERVPERPTSRERKHGSSSPVGVVANQEIVRCVDSAR